MDPAGNSEREKLVVLVLLGARERQGHGAKLERGWGEAREDIGAIAFCKTRVEIPCV